MKKLLLHTCCASCLTAPYPHIKNDFEVTAFWWNHNIHPITEYFARRDALRQFVKANNVEYIEHDVYGLLEFLKNAEEAGEDRCRKCYQTRMKITAKIAKNLGFDCFSTTLLYSIYQKHDLLKEVCEQIAIEAGVEFFYYDFREYWKEGQELTKEHGIYRQKYCGCIYSEMERYTPKKDGVANG